MRNQLKNNNLSNLKKGYYPWRERLKGRRMLTATTVQDMMREMAGLSYFVPSLPCAPKTQMYEYPLAQLFLK